eukprot:TRINITY_DN1537_c0_g1_i8.p1 TRINITY_DN1537_c0_g1~~TRINITY_DN1537_c0_g1_i8.p1  ORF type:complete len:352 (+),score=59.95 TRINITY_DN1537_c0_g1_i8:94-1149(+)
MSGTRKTPGPRCIGPPTVTMAMSFSMYTPAHILMHTQSSLSLFLLSLLSRACIGANAHTHTPFPTLPRYRYLCMQARADPNVQDKYGKTALHVACKYGHLDVVRFLIGRGADVNYVSTSPANVWSPLIYAANQGHKEVVKYLLLCGADPAYVCLDYTTAAEKSADDSVRSLITEAVRQQQESRARGTTDVQGGDIFLSHFSADREVALRVRDILVEDGFTVWVDEGRSDAADVRDALVDKVMRSCKLVVCLVSDAYAKNAPCIKEVALLDGLKKPAFSLRLGTGAQWPPEGVMSPILAAYPSEILEVSKDFKPVVDKAAEAAVLAGAMKMTTSDMIKKKMADTLSLSLCGS